jgi:hypothetical protein
MTSAVSQPPNIGALSEWFGVSAGPVLWSGRLPVSYILVAIGCKTGFIRPEIVGLSGIEIPVALVSIVAVLISLVAAGISWRNWRRLKNSNGRNGIRDRSWFMAVSGMTLSILFAAVMLVETAPIFVLAPCDSL